MVRRSTRKLRILLRVLHALMLREMITRYGRSSLGYLWAVLEPAAVIALLSLLFMQIAHSPPEGRSFPLFYASGYIAFHWFHDISSVTARSVHVNRPLLSFSTIMPLDFAIARFLLQAIAGLLVAMIVLGTILMIFPDPFTPDPVWLLKAFGLSCLLGFSVGLANCWFFAASRTWEIVWGVISRPLFLVSCVFFSFESLPEEARDVLQYNPVVHLVGALRAGLYAEFDSSHVSVGYVSVVSLALLITGLVGIVRFPDRLIVP